MNFCYADESGTGNEPFATMAGILVDSGRMHLTKGDWVGLLADLSQIVGRPVTEFHTADFYSGNGPWRSIDGAGRARVITAILNWLADRKHHIVYAAVDKASYRHALEAGEIPENLGSIWRFLGFHLILAIQKCSQREKNNKGNTVVVFDNHERDRLTFPELVKEPPGWSDDYYERTAKQPQLDQIVDVPYFADSEQVELLQVADFLSFFLRRYTEIQEGLTEKYQGEGERLAGWIAMIEKRSIGKPNIYPKLHRNEAHEHFFRHAPPCIRDL